MDKSPLTLYGWKFVQIGNTEPHLKDLSARFVESHRLGNMASTNVHRFQYGLRDIHYRL